MDSTGRARPRRYEAVTVLMPERLRQATAKAAENECCSMSDIVRSALLCKLRTDGWTSFNDLERPAS